MAQNPNGIPEWMKVQNDYSPRKDSNGFLAKTMLSLLKLFRHFHIEKNEGITAARALCRTVLVLGIIVLSALSKGIMFCGAVAAGFLGCLCLSRIEVLKRSLGTALAASFFTALIMLPSFFFYHSDSVVVITLKVFLSTGILSLYSLVTPWNKITAALRFIRIPSFIIFVLDLTIHYILILGNVSFEMLYALRLRSVGKNRDKGKSFSGILGTVFLKSVAITQETQQAMECRLFDGSYRHGGTKVRMGDFSSLVFLVIYILIYIYIE